MAQDRLVESQDERLLKPEESGVEEASGEAEVPSVSPATAANLLQGPVAGAQRQALVQNVAQHYGNRQVQRMLGSLGRSASAGLEGGPLEGDLIQQIQSERSNGQPLDGALRRETEQTVGYDLSQVRVHTGSAAAELNEQVGAKAFTTGRDIFFGAGQSPSDRELLAHEATHTVQQGMTEEAPSAIGAADTVHEHAAHQTATQATGSGGASGTGVQRESKAGEEEEQPPKPEGKPEEEEIKMMRNENAVQREEQDEDQEQAG